MVLVGRPDYRIDSRTIKGGSRVSSLFVSFAESSNLCILGIIFLGSCLVLFVSLRAYVHLDDKIEFIENGVHMPLYCVFGVVVFTGLIRGRVLTIFSWAFSNLLLIVISNKIVLALVSSFPTNLVSSNSESVCRSCGSFGVLKRLQRYYRELKRI